MLSVRSLSRAKPTEPGDLRGTSSSSARGVCEGATLVECCADGGGYVDDGKDGPADDAVPVGYKDRAFES